MSTRVQSVVNWRSLSFWPRLAWTLKAWAGLLLPVTGRWQEKHQAERVGVLRMEFKTFVNAFLKIPCQIVRQARWTIFRALNRNPHLGTFRLCTV